MPDLIVRFDWIFMLDRIIHATATISATSKHHLHEDLLMQWLIFEQLCDVRVAETASEARMSAFSSSTPEIKNMSHTAVLQSLFIKVCRRK